MRPTDHQAMCYTAELIHGGLVRTLRLDIHSLQVQIRRLPKPVVAMVAGYAVGGGHVLHMVCDLTIAAENAVFGQTGPKVGSFDAGYGSTQMAAIIGEQNDVQKLESGGGWEGDKTGGCRWVRLIFWEVAVGIATTCGNTFNYGEIHWSSDDCDSNSTCFCFFIVLTCNKNATLLAS